MSKINKGLFTSDSPEWETPQELFDKLDTEFNFGLDVCATDGNTKVKHNYYTKDDNSLNMNWNVNHEGWKWMNPPYGREIKDWIKKASEERKVVALIPARTDTRYFHDYIYNKPITEIRFIKGRVKFIKDDGTTGPAPFPSMIVIFN